MLSPYSMAVSKWRTTPLAGETFDDNDSGYRGVKLHQSQVAVCEPSGIIVREVYSGFDIQGNRDERLRLPGGLRDGKVAGVETVIRGIELANKNMQTISDGQFQLVLLEVIRTRGRQRAGHAKTYAEMLQVDGITNPDAAHILFFGRKADEIFSYTPPSTTTSSYTSLFEKLKKNELLVARLRETDELLKTDPVDGALTEYIAICASLGIAEVNEAKLEMPASHMVHGGGAFDAHVADKSGRVLSITPYDYLQRPEFLAFRFMEDDANYPLVIEQAKIDPILMANFTALGYSRPEEFTFAEWKLFQEANRMQIRLFAAMGATTYGPERWHNEFGTQVLNLCGSLAIGDRLAHQFPLSGGTGYTVIRSGKDGTAVWHTAVTEAALRKANLLEE